MNPRVFISYRRDDSLPQSREICTALQTHGAADSVFFDIRSVNPGDRWPDEIRQAHLNAGIVVVVILDGDRWLGVQKYGKRRIDEPDDWVRQEVALAIAQNKTVIPVLVGDEEQVVPAEHLPDDMQLLPSFQHIRLRRGDWDDDILKLIKAVDPASTGKAGLPPAAKLTGAELAARCVAALRDYNQKCVADWDRDKQPSRFVEPHLAIRTDPTIRDRSDSPGGEQIRQDHKSLLTDDEKQRPGGEMAVEQYRRLLEQRPKRQMARARLCVTEDAGAGKSIFTHHLRAVLASESGQAAFFGGQPGLVVRWEGREKTWPFDLRQALERELAGDCLAHGVAAGQVVDFALQQQSVCLILDALDQVTNDFTPANQPIERSDLLDRIFRFLNSDEGQRCHVVITGRSYAVTQEADGLHFPADGWTFATLEGFGEVQQQRYLADFLSGRQLSDFIPGYREVSELLAVPVILSLIAEIATGDRRPPAEVCLDQFQTRGDLYREAHERLADRAAKNRIKANDTARARWEAILSAAAFAMMCDEQQRRNYAVPGSQAVTMFRATTAKWARTLNRQSLKMTDKDWDDLTVFSQLTHHLSVESCTRSMVSWKHRGWLEYFAGMYLARYAPAKAIEQAAKFSNDPDWHWAWRFAIEMPANVADAETRTAALATLFRRPASGRRPSELIYRAWKVLESTAEVTLAQFQREFHELLDQGHPLAVRLEASFRPCPPDPTAGKLTFLMGSPETEKDRDTDEEQCEMTVASFRMSNAPITKAQFWRYDPAHQHDPSIAGQLQKYSPQDDCPVSYVTWYDAWCFARWCGSRLPTEVQWEYACRAGTTTAYWWGNEMDPSKCTFATSHTTPASASHANPWDLMEMSGNVFEWCDSWYDWQIAISSRPEFDGNSRVLRGGSFVNDPLVLRSAFRVRYSPVDRDYYIGFRVSRTP